MKTAIITGSNGFVGKHLTEYLQKKKIKTLGLDLPKVNLLNKELIDMIIYTEKPDYIFHLAGKAFVKTSFDDPRDVLINNIIPAVNIFESVKKYGLSTKIMVACSSEEYGKVKENEVPIKETNEIFRRSSSPYAISKMTMEALAKWYAETYGLNIYISRAFNHSGFGRGEQYMTSTFAKQIVEIENGAEPVIKVGNLEAKRDITDVRDMVRAYWLLVEKCIPGEAYNISSGTTYKVEEILQKLIKLSKYKKEIAIKQEQGRMRPSEVPILLGDCSKFKKQTGWKREYNINKTLNEILRYWRSKENK